MVPVLVPHAFVFHIAAVSCPCHSTLVSFKVFRPFPVLLGGCSPSYAHNQHMTLAASLMRSNFPSIVYAHDRIPRVQIIACGFPGISQNCLRQPLQQFPSPWLSGFLLPPTASERLHFWGAPNWPQAANLLSTYDFTKQQVDLELAASYDVSIWCSCWCRAEMQN